MAEKAEGKVLWVLPKNTANELLGALIVTTVLALIWSWVMQLSFVSDNTSVQLIAWLLLAALIGWYVGMVRGNAMQSTLWIAAGFTALGYVLTSGFGAGGAAGYGVDSSFLGSLQATVFSPEVSGAYIVLGIIAAVFATIGGKSKM